ncbi:MAG TPA: hypothetical protein PKI46_05170, partial [Bacteroidales bacterium]|nr:hypothetical protein [Bacteroidales bacterium]
MAFTRESIYLLWLSNLKADLIREYERLGLRASGSYEKELEYMISGKKIEMYGAYHSQFMQSGRSKTEKGPEKGKGKLSEIILKWIDDKKITPRGGISKKTLAFLITRKIHREGIKVPNKYNEGGVISNVITDERIEKLLQ